MEKMGGLPEQGNESKKEWWADQIPAKSWEAPETYLDRVTSHISGRLTIDSIDWWNDESKEKLAEVDWDKLEPLLFKEMEKLFQKIPERMPIAELNNEIRRFADKISYFSNPTEDGIQDEHEYYEQTVRNRGFKESVGSRPEKLARSLFGSGVLTDEHLHELMRQHLEGKKLILLGGGDSINDLIKSEDIHLASVVNLDPFLISEDIDKNQNKNYMSLPIAAEDIHEHLPEIDKADEIWATWSVPLYLKTSEDIHQMFQNVDKLLSAGGICRIYPLDLLNFEGEDPKVFPNTDSFEDRKNAWISAVVTLLKTKKYNMSIMNYSLLYLQKIAD